jgi:hypothetical protein
MDLHACVDILKQRNATSHNDTCPCCSSTESNGDASESKSIPEPEDMLSFGNGCYLEAITELFALQRTRVQVLTMFDGTMLCAVQCSAVQCSAVLCCAVPSV